MSESSNHADARFIAGLHGTTPLLISHNLINNTSPTPTLYPHCLRQVTVHELDFLTHVAAHAIDEEYSTSCQRLWASATREVRLHPDITVGQNLRNWAELRYCWWVRHLNVLTLGFGYSCTRHHSWTLLPSTTRSPFSRGQSPRCSTSTRKQTRSDTFENRGSNCGSS